MRSEACSTRLCARPRLSAALLCPPSDCRPRPPPLVYQLLRRCSFVIAGAAVGTRWPAPVHCTPRLPSSCGPSSASSLAAPHLCSTLHCSPPPSLHPCPDQVAILAHDLRHVPPGFDSWVDNSQNVENASVFVIFLSGRHETNRIADPAGEYEGADTTIINPLPREALPCENHPDSIYPYCEAPSRAGIATRRCTLPSRRASPSSASWKQMRNATNPTLHWRSSGAWRWVVNTVRRWSSCSTRCVN
jgi:hypothetical protein